MSTKERASRETAKRPPVGRPLPRSIVLGQHDREEAQDLCGVGGVFRAEPTGSVVGLSLRFRFIVQALPHCAVFLSSAQGGGQVPPARPV